jgi:hypothetical protein
MPPLAQDGANLSIIIPTYNCASYLVETLRSLQDQGPAVAEAEIVVVDDCSTLDDPEAVTASIWPGRVRFERQPHNVGPVPNFNSCLRHATRDWIHILHGDDYVLPGAYAHFARRSADYPDCTAVFARSVVVNRDRLWSWLTPLLGPELQGRLAYHARLWTMCPVQFAGALISQAAVAAAGEFDESFVHVADWNMWWRIASCQPVAYTNACLGAYRVFPGNHTSTLRRTGKNIQESVEQVRRVVSSAQPTGQREACALPDAYGPIFDFALNQLKAYTEDPEAFSCNLRAIRAIPLGAVTWPRRLRLAAAVARHLARRSRTDLRVGQDAPRRAPLQTASPLNTSEGRRGAA